MNNQEIINSLNKYQQQQFQTNYLGSCIKYFKQLTKPIKNLGNTNEKLLTGVKINLFYNIQKFHCYLSNQEIKDVMCIRKLNLSKKGLNNLINQIDGINTNNFKICKKLESHKELYYYINDQPIKEILDQEIPRKLFYEVNSILLGIHSFYFLEHQNLDNYCKKEIISNASKNVLPEIYDFKFIYNKLSWEEKDRLLVFSGLVYHFLGAIYTSDVDLIYLSNNDNNFNKYFQKFKNFDMHIILRNKVIKTQDNRYMPYLKNWLTYELPQLADIENIYTLILNPKHHFHFMGFKCMNIYATLRRSISRSSSISIVDLYLIKKFNNIDFLKEFCFKNISVRQGKAIIQNNDLSKNFKYVKKIIKEWYNIDLSIEFLEKHFKKCDQVKQTIYSDDRRGSNRENGAIFRFNREVVKNYLTIYSKDSNNLLDIGIGKSSAVKDYNLLGIKNIYGIEPSLYSINKGKEIVDRIPNLKSKLKVIHGFGEQKFVSKDLLSQKFETVILTFSIHYMINEIDTLIDNIKKVTKKGSIVMIYCLNGKLIYQKIKKENKYEIKFKNEPYWGVYKYNDEIPKAYTKDFKMLFYFKDVYGVKNGSEEYLVNIDNLIKKMKGFKLEVNNSFLDELKLMDKNKHNINLDFQEKILELHQVLIFRKN
jgi:hypothetical protein